MSWSVYTMGLAADIDARVDALEPPYTATAEREDQVKAAKEAAKALIASGAVGRGPGFSVSLVGHANPAHQPAQGWATDAVTVSVTQVTESDVTKYDAQQVATIAGAQ